MATIHSQVVRCGPGGAEVLVDAGLADVLAYLWGLGCATEFSCQGGAGELAQIGFCDFASLELAVAGLVSLARNGDQDDLGWRILQLNHDPADLREIVGRSWVITAWPKPQRCSGEVVGEDLFYCALWFPSEDVLVLQGLLGGVSTTPKQPMSVGEQTVQ